MTEENKSVKKFPNSGNIPKLRFSEFTEEWEERYISEVISSKSKKYNPENSDSNYRSIELESLSQDSGELLSTFDSKNQKSIKNVFNSGDVLFGKLRPYLKKYYLADFDGVCSSEIWVLKSSILDSDYLYAFVQSNSFISLTEKSSGSKMPRADWNLVSSSLIVYPSNTNERKKIGKTIQFINSRIQTQRKIIEGLQTSKLSLSNKIFAQKLRFKDSNGKTFREWSYKTLGEVGEIVNGLTYSPNDINESGVLVLRSSNVHNRTLVLNDNVFVKAENFNAVKEDDILICVRNGSKNLIGKNTIIKKENEGLAFGAFMSVYRSDYNKFIYQWFDTNDYKEIVKKNLGATINSINGSDLKKFKIPFPSVEEQTKIANFLKHLDDKINLETELLNQYENQKKYLLQNLFV
ncbi:restriction endonuclease subunit S [Elizabethkingia anophelis]|nr:restriction endonuclease subunit S [Elizabethkingia anophelis]